MNKKIVTLCLIFIALAGASAVAASSDVDNSSYVELDDAGYNEIISIDVEPNIQIEDNASAIEPKTLIDDNASVVEPNTQIEDNASAVEHNTQVNNSTHVNKSSEDDLIIKNCTFIDDPRYSNYEEGYANYTKLMNLFIKHDFGNLSDEELFSHYDLYNEIVYSYGAGHPTLTIALDHCMDNDMVQNIVETYFKAPTQSEVVRYILEEYGSCTINTMAVNLGVTDEFVKNIINRVLMGKYGGAYKKIFFKRNLFLHNNCEMVNSVLEDYGSGSLNTLANDLGMSEGFVLKIIRDLKNGDFGDAYKKMFLQRDRVSYYSHNFDFIIF